MPRRWPVRRCVRDARAAAGDSVTTYADRSAGYGNYSRWIGSEIDDRDWPSWACDVVEPVTVLPWADELQQQQSSHHGPVGDKGEGSA